MTLLADPLREARRAVQAGRFREAADLLASAPPDLREAPEWGLLSAMASWRLGRFTDSRRQAVAARDRYREHGDTDGEMRAENVAAAGAFALGDLEEAERGFGRALLLARRLGDEVLAARCANNLGNVAFYLARHDEAGSFYRLANAEFSRLSFLPGVAETWINLGLVARDLQEMAEARDAAERAHAVAAQTDLPRLVAQAFASRGEAEAALGDVELGRAQVRRALDLARTDEDRLAEVEALRLLANIECDAGNLAAAERLIDEALAVVDRLDHPWAAAEVQRDRGAIAGAAGRRGEAADTYQAAAANFLRLGSVPRATQMETIAAAWRQPGPGV